ncbi:MAG: DUF4835 family protein [Bacteroidales bacterium]|nr:DUF4835 family protein [Bacteroidales bacterium]
MTKFFLSFSLVFILPWLAAAQEFNASVQVSAPQIQQTNREKFSELRKGLYEFVNDRHWTQYSYKIDERIECTIGITITEEVSSDEFRGRINLVLKRPIYGTSYNSTVFNYIDNDFQFQWQEGQSIDFSENSFTSNLTATIAYYIYIFLGLDFDSYQSMGGNPYFEKAQNVVNVAQSARESGWKAFESMKNRYWLAENYTNSSYSNIRKANYQYHRRGLDLMYDNVENGRQGIMEALEMLQRAHREKPRLFAMQLFVDAKRDEFINIFSDAAPMDKTKAVNILKEIDPSHANDYQKIISQN